MIALGIVLGYFALGLWLARKRFDALMGDAKRIEPYLGSSSMEWTYTFTVAFWISLSIIFFWPLIFPISTLVFGETAHERLARQQKEEKELRMKFRQLEAEVMAFGKKV